MVETSADGLTYEPIEGDPIDKPFNVNGQFVCHVGPDAGWRTLKPFLEGADKALPVAKYDFNADYIAKTLSTLLAGMS
jgi:hypothetical protein